MMVEGQKGEKIKLFLKQLLREQKILVVEGSFKKT